MVDAMRRWTSRVLLEAKLGMRRFRVYVQWLAVS
jgi:hypothetical protein